MYRCHAKIKGTSSVMFSRYHGGSKEPKENWEDYEKRTWILRLHTDDKGQVYMPDIMWKSCLFQAAKYLSMPIPGDRRKTYTKYFEAGMTVEGHAFLGVYKDDVKGTWLLASANGIRGGSGSKVLKCFPEIENWETTVTFIILDETITREVFEEHLREAGRYIGVGSFRPRNGGVHGRFIIESFEYEEVEKKKTA